MRKIIFFFSIIIILSLASNSVKAQCPMCKTAIESAMKDKNNTKGMGLNNGILYLLSMPYLLVGIGGTIWYLKSKKSLAK